MAGIFHDFPSSASNKSKLDVFFFGVMESTYEKGCKNVSVIHIFNFKR